MGRDAHDARAPGYWLLVGPFFSTPHSKGALERLLNPSVDQPLNSWAIMAMGAFSFSYPSYLWWFATHWVGEPSSGTSFKGVVRGGMCMIPREV
jgi:hypothetical protein